MYLTQIVGPMFCKMIGKSRIPFHSLFCGLCSPPLSYRQATVKLILGLEGVSVRPLRTGNNLHFFNTLRLLDLTSCHLSLCNLAIYKCLIASKKIFLCHHAVR